MRIIVWSRVENWISLIFCLFLGGVNVLMASIVLGGAAGR